MSFTAAVNHLHALGLELSATRRKFELDHMRILARALGDPQTRFPSVLIAGTNGKGSTAATLAAILAAAGLRTGLYTSPHLTRVTERIRTTVPVAPQSPSSWRPQRVEDRRIPLRLNARRHAPPRLEPRRNPRSRLRPPLLPVDDAARSPRLGRQLPHHPSFFETLTALAFLYFAEQELDIAVLEVGLGGRLDATNIVEPSSPSSPTSRSTTRTTSARPSPRSPAKKPASSAPKAS